MGGVQGCVGGGRDVWVVCAECKTTAGHWPISNHFSKMADHDSSMVHSLCTYSQSNSSGKMSGYFNFFPFCTLYVYVRNVEMCGGMWGCVGGV